MSPDRLRDRVLFFYRTKLLNVDGFHHFLAVYNRGFLESLAAAKFFHDAGFFKFAFEFFERYFDVFDFFYF